MRVVYVNVADDATRRARARAIAAIERRSSAYPVAVIRVGRIVHYCMVDQWVITREVSAMLEAADS